MIMYFYLIEFVYLYIYKIRVNSNYKNIVVLGIYKIRNNEEEKKM